MPKTRQKRGRKVVGILAAQGRDGLIEQRGGEGEGEVCRGRGRGREGEEGEEGGQAGGMDG